MTVGQCAGFVLAGGRSSRMGTDKALLVFHRSTLIEKACAVVEEAAGAVTIVGDAARYSGFGYPVIPDIVYGCGPLGGIHAALHSSKADWNLMVACDMPGLNVKPLAGLLEQVEQSPQADVLIPVLDGRAQPLCAVYHRRALPVIEKAVLNGRWKIMQAIDSLRAVCLETGDEGLFQNVNTPEEWGALVRGRI